jgi:hypothetical protein
VRAYAIGLLLAASCAAHAQQQAAAPPIVYALVSAVGDQFSLVRQKQQVGTNIIDHFERHMQKIPGDALNVAVLRGLDRVVAEADPAIQRVYVTLNAAEMEGVAPQERERVAIGKVISALAERPERAQWTRIIAVTPRYLFSEREGMGTKLQGIGVYVQPLGSASLGREGPDAIGPGGMDPDTVTPDGNASRSRRFIAPFFYTKIWVIDAKTLEIISSDERYDFRRIYDPKWTANNIEANLSAEELAATIETFVERSSAKALREAIGVVTVTDPKPVDPGKAPKAGAGK